MADFKTYKALLRSGESSPSWLLKPKGAVWLGGIGEAKDVTLERLKAAIKLRFPSRAPADGLSAIGDERVLERAPGDTNATYAARLQDAWNLWRYGGTALGLLRALRDIGHANAIVAVVKGSAFYLDAGGELVTVALPTGSWCCSSARPSFWSKFVVFLPANPWGVGVEPSNADPRIELIRRTIRRWKSAFSVCSDIAVLDTGRMWDWPITIGHAVRTWDNQEIAGWTWGDSMSVLHYTP